MNLFLVGCFVRKQENKSDLGRTHAASQRQNTPDPSVTLQWLKDGCVDGDYFPGWCMHKWQHHSQSLIILHLNKTTHTFFLPYLRLVHSLVLNVPNVCARKWVACLSAVPLSLCAFPSPNPTPHSTHQKAEENEAPNPRPSLKTLISSDSCTIKHQCTL